MGHPFAVADSGREEHPDQVAEQALGELVAAPAPPTPPCALWKGHRVTLCPEGHAVALVLVQGHLVQSFLGWVGAHGLAAQACVS